MSDLPLLLPAPRRIASIAGAYPLADARLIALDSPEPHALFPIARRLQAALADTAGLTWQVVAGVAAPRERVGISLSVAPGGARHPQGYELTITPDGIHVVAGAAAGVFYAVCTLVQLLQSALQPPTSNLQSPTSTHQLPALRISDWPDFPARGVMLDVSRDRVPTMATLFDLVDMLAGWKVNQLQLYTEHTFAYRSHPEVWAEASPLTGEEILALDAYCRERFIELVPNQNSFGHMERWLRYPRYSALAETSGAWVTPWGETREDGFSLCPLDPGSLELVRTLYDELLPHFSSRMVNVGCDETFDLGQGRSREACLVHGRGRVYLDFLQQIYREVRGRGRTMQFWGDIIVEHPELIGELPRDVIALEWGYEEAHPFAAHGEQFAAAGIPFYLCPGTSAWSSIAGRTKNALGNLRSAAENGLRHGAVGYLNTDWGDMGHWQPPPVSTLGLAYGAGVSWAFEANRDLDLVTALSRYAFRDPTGAMAHIAYELGNAYLQPGVLLHNSSVLFWILHRPLEWIVGLKDLSLEGLRRTLAYVDAAAADIAAARPARPDADLLRREFAWVAALQRHACRRGIWALEGLPAAERPALAEDAARLIAEHRALWLARSRPGGLADSVARLERMRQDYL